MEGKLLSQNSFSLVPKVEIILSTQNIITVKKGEEFFTLTGDQLFRLAKKHKIPSTRTKKEVGGIDKYDLDIPKKRTGEGYFLLYQRIKDLGFSDKRLEHNILDCQRKGVVNKKWRKDGMIHIPSFLMDASEGEILKVLNFQK